MTQKAAIGKLAASLVQREVVSIRMRERPRSAIAQHLIHMESLTVVTNDFVIGDNDSLDNSNCTLIYTGGAVCRENRSCVGKPLHHAAQPDDRLGFISASSWSVRGISRQRKIKSR
ncbi:hypothetical protein ACNKHU_16550 [Shigella flexneri]